MEIWMTKIIFKLKWYYLHTNPRHVSGVFRPPVDGVYQLTFYGLVAIAGGGGVYIKRNDDLLCQGYLRPEQYDTSTCTAIAELTTDDSVRVTGSSGDPTVLRGGLQSGFTGFHIYDS